MATELDIGPLTWVKGEIDQALDQARQNLAGFFGNPGDLSPLRYCLTHLHQVNGAIMMVGLDGAARVSSEIEKLVAALEKQEVASSAANSEVVNQAIAALSKYLSGLLDGEPDVPLRLYPVYKSLRQARNASGFAESDLFFPDLSARAPKDANAKPVSEAELQVLAKAERARFQRGLLKFLRTPDDPAGMEEMRVALLAIERAQSLPAQRTFWWSAGALIEGLLNKGLSPDAEAKRLLGKIDQQIRKLVESSPKVAEHLLRDLLYRVACSQPVSERIKQVKHVFDLDSCLPQAATAVEVDSARLQPLLRELKELLAPVKELWLKFTTGHKESLKNLQEPLSRLVEKSRALDNRPLHGLLAQTQALAVVHPEQDGAGEMLAIEVATALLLAENVLENFVQFNDELAKQLEIQTQRMSAVLNGRPEEIDAAGIPHLGDISRKAQRKLLLAQVAHEIQANLRRIEEVLDAFFRDTTKREGIPSLESALKQISGALTILDLGKADKLLGICHSSIQRFADPAYEPSPEELEGVAEGLSSLGFYIEEVQHGRADAENIISRTLSRLTGEPEEKTAVPQEEVEETLAEESIEASLDSQKHLAQENFQEWQANPEDLAARQKLEKSLSGLAQDAELVADSELKEQATTARRLLDEEPEAPAAGLAGAVAALAETKVPVAPSQETERLLKASAEAIDAELLETYLEEAAEVLATVSENLQASHEQPGDREALTTIRRGFHTLKGSGRMVGLTDLGEVAWVVEQVINKWLQDERAATPALLNFIEQACAAFEQWVGQLQSKGAVAVEADALIAAAEQLRSGEEMAEVAPQASATPAPIEEELAPAEESAEEIEEISLPSFEVIEEVAAEIGAPGMEEPLAFELPLEEAVADGVEPVEEIGLPVMDFDFIEEVATEMVAPAEEQLAAEVLPAEETLLEATEPDEEISQPTFEAIAPAAGVEIEAPAIDELTSVAPGLGAEEIAPEPLPETEIVIGDVTLSSALFDIFMSEAKQRVAVLQEELARLEDQPDLPIREDFMRAAHTLCGISRTVGLPAPAELSFELEEWLKEMLEHPQPANGKQVKVTGDAVIALNKMVRAIEEQKMPKPAKQVARSLQALVKKARADGEKAASSALAERAVAEVVRPTASFPEVERRAEAVRTAAFEVPMPTSRDDIDLDILPLFLEEAQDLYPLVGTQVRAWLAKPADQQAPQDLQRSLHTFKGSARMAGALQLGDLVHNMETRVVDSTEAGAPAASLFDELFAYFDKIGDMLDRLQAGPEAPIAKEVAAGQPDIQPPASAAKPGAQHLRVRADVLDRLVNEAGEISIARSRVEGEMQGFKQSLLELTENVIRLRNQVREIEIQAESRMQSQANQTGGVAEAFDPLEFDRFTRFQELTRFLAESVNDVATVQQSLLKSLGEADAALLQQARQNRELQQELMHIRMVPLSSIADRLHRIVRQTARELDKKASLEIKGGEVELDRSVLEKMTAPFEHLLRNSLAHGVESAADRIRAGKPETGAIRIEARQEGNEIVLALGDDGAGFNLKAIRRRAVQMGRLPADSDISPARLVDMVFEPGFSTAQEVTQVAGRGVGLDAVRSEITGLGGRVEAAPGEHGGVIFNIYLPLTLAVAQAVLVRTGEKIYALPSAMVEQVKEFKSAGLEEIRQKGEIEWQNNRYPLFYLPRLLGDLEQVPETHRYAMTLLLRSGNQRVAVQVDEILGNQEIVIKNIGPQLARVPGIAGATVLGNGQVALIINPAPLVQRIAMQVPAASAAAPTVPRVETVAPTIMVVDDSLTVRKITARLLAKEGYQVVTARDGVDALQHLQEIVPDVMLVDIEMPRMDGFELTKNVRSDPQTAHIPIIIITSRTAEKHRNYAMELGVNAYLGKPFQEDELLGHIAGFLKAGFIKKP
ncbi:Hpt domain-containing protein [Sulfuricella sp.]|uniref:Hpt domain-containing protein n=1 Tax=Sulfuricella sp. TaxID=2099377 RepID=UPI002CDEF97A|nr:Hpt domain-containing protein [Sulfuricella sp.]HUX65266.1 Hpt domain-containing protein [Sulfuricella sp.]